MPTNDIPPGRPPSDSSVPSTTVVLDLSSSGLRRIAYVDRGGEWVAAVSFGVGDREAGVYHVRDDLSKRELAAVTLAVACEGVGSDGQAN